MPHDPPVVWLTMQEAALPVSVDLLGPWYDWVEVREAGWVTVFVTARRGLLNERAELTRAGFAFHGTHSASVDLPETLFVAIDGVQVAVPAIHGTPVAYCDEDGANGQDEDDACRYYELLARATERIKQP